MDLRIAPLLPPSLSPIKELCQTLNEKGKEGGGIGTAV